MDALTAIEQDIRGLWRPPPRLTLSQWADQKFYLSPESSAEPGQWTTIPFQKGWMDAFTDPSLEYVVVKKSARVGYTKTIVALTGYHAEHDPCPIMIVQPTDDDAEQFSKQEIAPMLRDCEAVGKRFTPGSSRKTANTLLNKTFTGGMLSMTGANSGAGFRRITRRVIIFDEVDGYPMSAGADGDPIKLGIKRGETFWNRKVVLGSTPLIESSSRIETWFKRGDQRFYFVPCPHCQEFQTLKFPNMKWPKGEPAKAWFMCEKNGCVIEHASKRWMVERGEWRGTAKPESTRLASFHIWTAYSYSPNATWGHIAQEFEVAKKEGPESLKTFINTTLGECWIEKGEAPEYERLYGRRETYPMRIVPPGAYLLTAGVDVQKDRLVAEVVAWGLRMESWSIDWITIPGDTSTDEPWTQLDGVLNRNWPHANGGELRIRMMAVDSGYNTQRVYAWCKAKGAQRVMAVKGDARGSQIIGTPRNVDTVSAGKRRGLKLWLVGVDILKSELYGWLGLKKPKDDSEPIPAGYCHFPEYGEDYFLELTAEHLVSHRDRQNRLYREWEVIPGRRNEVLDARIYARAAAYLVGADRVTERDVPAPYMLRAAGSKPDAAPQPQPAVAVPVDVPPAPRQQPNQAPNPPKRSWLGSRKGYLR
jgi:phage terminase large subunit GpA-like protein